MDKEDIKQRLAGYRPEIYDDDDPQIAEALRLARRDPDLSAWLDAEIAFDREFASLLGAVPSNQVGMEQLLSVAREKGRRRVPRMARRLLAAAAVLVFGAVVVKHFGFPPAVEFPRLTDASVEDYRDHLAYFATQRFTLDHSTSNLEEVRSWLAEHQLPVYEVTPGEIARFKGLGCKEIDWNGGKVSMVCFLNNQEQIVHLFVVEGSRLSGRGTADLASNRRFHNLETQGWRDERFVYLLVGSDPDVSLAGLL